MTNVGRPPEPSRYGVGYTRASEPVPQDVSQAATPTGYAGLQSGAPSYSDPAAPVPPRRSGNGLVLVYGLAAVLLVLGGFLAGRLTAPKATLPAAAGASSTPGATHGGSVSLMPAVVPLSELAVIDPAGDAVPHPPADGKTYGPSDITNFSVRSDGTDLIVTTTYTPATPMNLVSTETGIRLNPDTVSNCKYSVLDSLDWTIDYDAAAGGTTVWKPGVGCNERLQSTSITGAADINGSTLTLRVAQASLGIRSGQRIVVRTSASTRIDANSTTFIQDWAPNSPSGATGTI